MPSSALRDRQRAQRDTHRQSILRAADRFLREHPYRELSVEVLMSDTGLTRTSFYRHFDDLGQLVLALLDMAGVELSEIASAWAQVGPDRYLSEAHTALARFVDFFARNGPVIGAVAQATSYDGRIEEGYRRFRDGFVEMTAEALRRAGVEPAHDIALALNLMNERYLLETFGDAARQGDRARATATLERIWTGAVVGPRAYGP